MYIIFIVLCHIWEIGKRELIFFYFALAINLSKEKGTLEHLTPRRQKETKVDKSP